MVNIVNINWINSKYGCEEDIGFPYQDSSPHSLLSASIHQFIKFTAAKNTEFRGEKYRIQRRTCKALGFIPSWMLCSTRCPNWMSYRKILSHYFWCCVNQYYSNWMSYSTILSLLDVVQYDIIPYRMSCSTGYRNWM